MYVRKCFLNWRENDFGVIPHRRTLVIICTHWSDLIFNY